MSSKNSWHPATPKNYPAHRRVDPAKARLRCSNRSGNIAVSITAANGDYEYAARKLIHTVHEIFMVFLVDELGLEQDKY